VGGHIRDHWWWRPGWRPGRRFWTWHLTFDDHATARGQAALREVAEYYQAPLAKLRGLDLVPFEWLHLTMQGIGFVDEVPERDVQQIITAVRTGCARLAPLALALGPAVVGPEGITLRVTPPARVAQVRDAVRRAIAEVWGEAQVPESAEDFRPHVSLAYSNADGPAGPYAALLHGLEPQSAAVTLRAVRLIVLGRDTHLYRWEPYATVPFGEAVPGTSGS